MLSESDFIPAIDLHSDYLSCRKDCVTSPEILKSSPVRAQFFAIFLPPKKKRKPFLFEELDRFRGLLKDHGFIHGRTPEIIINEFSEKNVIAVPCVEDAEILDIPGKRDWAVSLGVRYVTIVHNHSNRYAGSSMDDGGGLTLDGKKLIKWLEGRRILPDVSHASEDTFKDILSITKGPVIASHSCSFSLNPHHRNLKDYQIKEIAGTGGVIGVNFYPYFLSGNPTCSIEKLVEHIKYIVDIAGIDFVALGSDFDGISSTPEGLNTPANLILLKERLFSAGFSRKEVEKIFYRNVLRVLNRI